MTDIKIAFTPKIQSPYDLHKPYELQLKPGYTALVGPNGAGKTTLLHLIQQHASKAGYETILYDNQRHGGSNAISQYINGNNTKMAATALCSSEGEQIAINFGQKVQAIGQAVRKAVETDTPLFILLDSLDSGASIDRTRELLNLFDIIGKEAGVRQDKAEHAIYIIAAVNNYELARRNCMDPRTGKNLTFTDYDNYADFICKYFEKYE